MPQFKYFLTLSNLKLIIGSYSSFLGCSISSLHSNFV